VLAAVLLSPVAAALLRKFWPGQPVFIEAAPALTIILAFLWAMPKAKDFPAYIGVPLLIWFGIQVLYLIPTAMQFETLAASAVVVRLVPMMLPVIAFAAIRSPADFRLVSITLGVVALAALPVGIFAGFWSEDGLPYWLRSIDSFSFGGSELRAGLPAVSFVFSTPAVLSTTMGATAFLSIAAIKVRNTPTSLTILLSAVVISSLLLLLLSTRRGMLIIGVIALFSFFWGRSNTKIFSVKIIFYAIVILGIFTLVNIYGFSDEYNSSSRFEFITSVDYERRINEVFLGIWSFWFDELPMGMGLGTAGPEVNALNISTHHSISTVVEVGIAQLQVEMGILGVIGFPVILIAMSYGLFSRSKNTDVEGPVFTMIIFITSIFLLFYIKEKSILTGMWVIVMSFWAVPGICAALIVRDHEKAVLLNDRSTKPTE